MGLQIKPTNRAFKITAVYLLLGAVWIYGSDRLLESMITDPALLNVFQTYKGWFFVFVTSILLFFLINRSMQKIDKSVGLINALLEKEKQARHDIEEEKKKFENIILHAPTPMCFLEGEDHTFTFANTAYQEMIGDRELIGKPVLEAVPEVKSQGFITRLDQVYKSGEMYLGKEVPLTIHQNGDQKTYYRDFIYEPLKNRVGEVYGIFVVAIDITRQIESRQELENLVSYKDQLLQELHHRVKNNLAVIIGLIELQSDQVDNTDSVIPLRNIKSRIHVIAGIHELLYQQLDLKNIPLDQLIEVIANTVFRKILSYRPDIHVQFEDLNININQAISLGLTFNEIFLFLGVDENQQKKREIRIESGSSEASDIRLIMTITQAGKDFKEKLTSKEDSFEGTLLKTFLNQLNATMSSSFSNGITKLEFHFSNVPKKGAYSNIV